MADKLREQIALTSVEIAVICGRFSRLKEQSKKPIGYHTLADMTAHFQRKKALYLFKSQVEGLTVIGDEEIQNIADNIACSFIGAVANSGLDPSLVIRMAIAQAQLQECQDKLLGG